MTRNRTLLSAALTLLFTAGAALAQNQNCPRANCPNPGQNCPRNGQCMRQGGNARGGPAAVNRGMGRGRMMGGNGSGNAVNTPSKPEIKK